LIFKKENPSFTFFEADAQFPESIAQKLSRPRRPPRVKLKFGQFFPDVLLFLNAQSFQPFPDEFTARFGPVKDHDA
jgi:hypothetical protein